MSAFAAAWSSPVGLVLFGFTAFPVLLALALRLVLGLDVVTVFGPRSRATLHFSVRKARAREVFRLLSAGPGAAAASGALADGVDPPGEPGPARQFSRRPRRNSKRQSEISLTDSCYLTMIG
jgi:hypothetical protein